ncbi:MULTISPECIES: hypothetical protein [unclassified Caulobacter]|uniref:hypothetical protein n=1 Tax=unclassified Caulobacter TaxID=2648921 RepID=UPI0013C7480C|nr:MULTISPECIES: hypothetical protein [unclassified Caulobacter]MBC6981724.1 hypothetical protein [Caulobacter sp. 17J80-11]NEX92221.1 hypothetical protein [Caulobacter sp. 17J65-9]
MAPDPKTTSLAKYFLGLILLFIGLALEAAGLLNHSRNVMLIGLVFIVAGAAQIAWRLAQEKRAP